MSAIRKYLFFIIICMFWTQLYSSSPDTLSGDISQVVFDSTRKFYRVVEEINVPAGTEVKIPSGIIILFNENTGLRIDGNCQVGGTGPAQVIFTSVHDTISSDGNGQPTIYDWKGVVVSQSSDHAVFENVSIRYAEHPLVSSSAGLVLRSCFRIKTSDNFFTLKGIKQHVEANVPFSSPLLVSPLEQDSLVSREGYTADIATQSTSKGKSAHRKWIRWTLFGTGTAALLSAAGCAVGYAVFYGEYQDEIARVNEWADVGDFTRARTAQENADRDASKSRTSRIAGIVSGGIGVFLLTGFCLTFYF